VSLETDYEVVSSVQWRDAETELQQNELAYWKEYRPNLLQGGARGKWVIVTNKSLCPKLFKCYSEAVRMTGHFSKCSKELTDFTTTEEQSFIACVGYEGEERVILCCGKLPGVYERPEPQPEEALTDSTSASQITGTWRTVLAAVGVAARTCIQRVVEKTYSKMYNISITYADNVTMHAK
jgi:hypothetical protein